MWPLYHTICDSSAGHGRDWCDNSWGCRRVLLVPVQAMEWNGMVNCPGGKVCVGAALSAALPTTLFVHDACRHVMCCPNTVSLAVRHPTCLPPSLQHIWFEH